MPSLLGNVRAILLLLPIASVYSTFYLAGQNGTLDRIGSFGGKGPYLLPGTNQPLKQIFIGVKPIDDIITVLLLFFWPICNGENPAAALHGLDFAAQFATAYGLLLVETMRSGNQGKIISYLVIWGLAMQRFTYAVTLPVYLALYLTSSPTVTPTVSNLAGDLASVWSVPMSLVIGFVVPAVLLSLQAPSVISFELKQIFIAAWQPFPIWVSILQPAFKFLISGLLPSTRSASRYDFQPTRYIYMSFTVACAITRIYTLAITITSVVVPQIFSPTLRGTISPLDVFLPTAFLPSHKLDSLSAGAFLFLQWDEIMGSTALLLWSSLLYIKSDGQVMSWAQILQRVACAVLLTVFIGPSGCAVVMIWARDEAVFSAANSRGKKSM